MSEPTCHTVAEGVVDARVGGLELPRSSQLDDEEPVVGAEPEPLGEAGHRPTVVGGRRAPARTI